MNDFVYDFMGRVVQPGDLIFYSTTGRRPTSRVCRIDSFTPTGLPRVRVLKNHNSKLVTDNLIIVQNVFVKVEEVVESTTFTIKC